MKIFLASLLTILSCLNLAHATKKSPPNNSTSLVFGQLELIWGDGSNGQQVLIANLLQADGTRIPMNVEQAKVSAGDLYGLINQPVAVSIDYKQTGQMTIEAMVPVRTKHTSSSLPSIKEASAGSIGGNTPWVTVLCKFSDIDEEIAPTSFFRTQYNQSFVGLGAYWDQASYGNINTHGSTAKGWYRLPHSRDYYTPTGKRTKLYQLFLDCIAAADDDIDFTQYHGVNTIYNGDLDGFAWGGSGCAPFDGAPSYCKPGTWSPPWGALNLTSLAHEMGHGYGLPHSDNSDGDSDTYDNPWDNMSDNWNNAMRDNLLGWLPKQVSIYQRERLGWLGGQDKIVLDASSIKQTSIMLNYANSRQSGTKMIMVTLPGGPDPAADTLYSIEARKPGGAFDGALAGNAVIVHKIEGYGSAKILDTDRPPANRSNNEGSMLKPGETLHLTNQIWVTITSRTENGFVVRLDNRQPRKTGGRIPPIKKCDANDKCATKTEPGQ